MIKVSMNDYYNPGASSLMDTPIPQQHNRRIDEAISPMYSTDGKDEFSAANTASIGNNIDPPFNPIMHRHQQSNSNLREHFPLIPTNPYEQSVRSFDDIPCACCNPLSPLLNRRTPVAMGAGGLRASKRIHPPLRRSSMQGLGPVCFVPIPTAFENAKTLQELHRLFRVSVDTQTSPLPELDGSPRRQIRRRSGAQLVDSIKKKFTSIRRSLSSDRKAFYQNLDGSRNDWTPPNKRVQETANASTASSTTISLLKRHADGSRSLQLKRNSPMEPFGIFISLDSRGLFVSRLANVEHVLQSHKFLHVGDRVVSVQGVPAKSLDRETVRGLLKGCHVANIRLKAASTAR